MEEKLSALVGVVNNSVPNSEPRTSICLADATEDLQRAGLFLVEAIANHTSVHVNRDIWQHDEILDMLRKNIYKLENQLNVCQYLLFWKMIFLIFASFLLRF